MGIASDGAVNVSGARGVRTAIGMRLSIRSRKMPYRKFNLTVGELAPFFDDWSEAAPGRLIDDFAGFAASGCQRQRE
jgi:hypothetical protein